MGTSLIPIQDKNRQLAKVQNFIQELPIGTNITEFVSDPINLSRDYQEVRTIYETMIPETIYLPVQTQRKMITPTRVRPGPGWAYVVDEGLGELKVYNFGDREHVMRRFRDSEIHSVYMGTIMKDMVFSLATRIENTGCHARVIISYKIDDPVTGLKEDSIRPGFIPPYIAERANEIVNAHIDSSGAECPSDLKCEDHLEIRERLYSDAKSYFSQFGIGVSRMTLNIILPKMEYKKWVLRQAQEMLETAKQEELLKHDSKIFSLDLLTMEKRQLRAIQRDDEQDEARYMRAVDEEDRNHKRAINESEAKYRRSMEEIDNLHKIAQEKIKSEYDNESRLKKASLEFEVHKMDVETQGISGAMRLELVRGIKACFGGLEQMFEQRDNFPIALMIQQCQTYYYNMVMTGTPGREDPKTDVLLEKMLDAEIENQTNPLEVKKIVAAKGLINSLSLTIGEIDRPWEERIGKVIHYVKKFLDRE
jgi:hypothetical protein